MANEEQSRLLFIIVGAVLVAICLIIIWQEVRYHTAKTEIAQMTEDASLVSVETRQNEAALKLTANAYRAEAEQLRGQLAMATVTADHPLDRLAEASSKRDLGLCRDNLRAVFENRIVPLARKACSGSKPDPALAAAWKVIAKEVPEWGEFFRPRYPGFGAGCFEPVKVDDPNAGRVENDISKYPDLPSLINSYCIVSPERDYCLYLDYPTGEASSSARVWDLNGNRELWKLDCGTDCHWDYAVWLDSTTAAVIGLVETYYQPLPIYSPEVRLVQIKDGKVSMTGAFRGPEVEPIADGTPLYADQHKKWLTRKNKTRAQ